MARATYKVINLLRQTATQIQRSPEYQWGHMGACNCGFLAQQVTGLSGAEIHRRAMQGHGDWNEQLNDYCHNSGLLFDDIIGVLLGSGFDSDDLKHLENLSDRDVLSLVPRPLYRNNKEDVVLYLNTWAAMLEERMLAEIRLPLLADEKKNTLRLSVVH